MRASSQLKSGQTKFAHASSQLKSCKTTSMRASGQLKSSRTIFKRAFGQLKSDRTVITGASGTLTWQNNFYAYFRSAKMRQNIFFFILKTVFNVTLILENKQTIWKENICRNLILYLNSEKYSTF